MRQEIPLEPTKESQFLCSAPCGLLSLDWPTPTVHDMACAEMVARPSWTPLD
jgi:hypothetical protein